MADDATFLSGALQCAKDDPWMDWTSEEVQRLARVADEAGFRRGLGAAAKIVSDARFGEHDTDLRSIYHSIRAIPYTPLVTEENCPGHVASASDPKVCARCGIHIDSLRPEEPGHEG